MGLAVARRWPQVLTTVVSPGWVPTKMGGPGASDDLSLAHVTQTWLASSDDPDATVTGKVLYHQREIVPAAVARSTRFQDALLETLGGLTEVSLPAA